MSVIESPDCAQYVAHLEARLNNPNPLGKKIAEILRGAFQANFDAGGRPAWQPLTPNTLASKQANGYPVSPLIASGSLRESLISEAHPLHVEEIDETSVEVGTKHPVAGYHEGGTNAYTIRPKGAAALSFIVVGGQRVFTQEVNHPGLPARPMLTITDAEEDLIADAILDYVLGDTL